MSTPERKRSRLEQQFIKLSCPGCGAQVNTPTEERFARCFMCKQLWDWRRGSGVILRRVK